MLVQRGGKLNVQRMTDVTKGAAPHRGAAGAGQHITTQANTLTLTSEQSVGHKR